MTSFSFGFECSFKQQENSNIRYVIPVYRSNVTYFFDKSSREAFAMVNWEFDEDKTRECFKLGKSQYPESQIMIPSISVSKVDLKILGALDSVSLDVMPMSNGHWFASSQTVPVNYKQREMISKAIEQQAELIEYNGDARMRVTKIVKKSIGVMNCSNKEENLGILNLFNRMAEIKKSIEKINQSYGVKIENVFEDFFNKCVEFYPVDAKSLKEFNAEQKINSRIIKGDFSIMGYISDDTYEDMKGVSHVQAAIQDI